MSEIILEFSPEDIGAVTVSAHPVDAAVRTQSVVAAVSTPEAAADVTTEEVGDTIEQPTVSGRASTQKIGN